MASMLLSQTVYDWLLRGLLTNRLKPGDRLNRRQVAKEIGVSVAPVLEAMTQLEWEGFLETTPRAGTRVRQIEPEHVRGRMLLREAIETQAARAYCGQPIRENQARLLKLAQAVDASDPRAAANWRAEIKFHRALVELAACPVLLEAFDSVTRHSLFYAANRLLPLPGQRLVPNAHVRLVAALQTDDPQEAERVMRKHVHARVEAIPRAKASG